MHDRLSDLLLNNHYAQAIQLANELLRQNPKEIFARYHLGIALFLSGNRLTGLRELRTIFNDHYQAILSGNDPKEMQLLGFLGIQFAQLSELLIVRQDQELTLNFDLGIRIALEAGTQSDNRQLTQLAQRLHERIQYGHDPNNSIKIAYIRPDSPSVLQVEPTNHCNLKCIMCPRNEMTRATGTLTPEVWERILDTWQNSYRQFSSPFIYQQANHQFTTHTPGRIKFFFMGEPLLHKKMKKMIHMAHAKGCTLTVQTNGTLLKFPKIRQALLESAIDQIAVSIDGIDATTYATIRQGSQFKPLLAGLEAFHQERQAAGLEKELVICVSTITPAHIKDEEIHTQPLFQHLHPYVDHFLSIRLGRRNTTQFLNANGQIIDQPREITSALTTTTPGLCRDPLYKMNLLWNGAATPCCYDINGQLELGNVTTSGGVDALWQSQTMRSIQHDAIQQTPTRPLCRECLA